MGTKLRAAHFSYTYLQRRFTLAVYFYVCFRLQKPVERQYFSRAFNEDTTPSIESPNLKNYQKVLKTSFIFDNDVKSVTSSISFEKRPQWNNMHHGSVAVPFDSSSPYRRKSALFKNECDYYDCSFTSLRDLFFNGTHFSAGFISSPDDIPWRINPKTSHERTDPKLSGLGFSDSDQSIGLRPQGSSIIRSVALHRRSFVKSQPLEALRNNRRLQITWASMVNRRTLAMKSHEVVAPFLTSVPLSGAKASAYSVASAAAATAKTSRASKPLHIEESQRLSSSTAAAPTSMSRPSSLPFKPSLFFAAVDAAKGRLDIPVMDMNIAALKSSMDDGNIQKVIDVLQNNIKQWSFIESQLLEPNANLGMPEIFIPLRHLTTTLEILGNILYMKNEFAQAKEYLERACPLIELLPPSITMSGFSMDSEEGYETSLHEMQRVGSLRSFDEGSSLSFNAGGGTGDTNQRNKYAEGCYALLREVYGKIYKQQESERPRPEKPVQKQRAVRPLRRRHERCSKSRNGRDDSCLSTRCADRVVDEARLSHTSAACDNSSADSDDFDDSYCDDQTEKSDSIVDDVYEDESVYESSGDDYYDDGDDAEINDDCSRSDDDGECDQLSSSDKDQNFFQKIEDLRIPFEHLRSDHSTLFSSSSPPPPSSSLPAQRVDDRIGLRKRREYIPQAQRRQTVLKPEESQSKGFNENEVLDKSCDDLANPLLARPEALRGSYGKVTSTWPQVDNEILVNPESSGGVKSSVTVPVSSDIGDKIASRRRHRLSEGTLLRMTSVSSSDAGVGGDVLLLELNEDTGLPSRLPSAAQVSASHSSASSPHSLFAAFHSLGLDSEGFHNSATSVIAGDLEDMLRTFVLEDSYGRDNVLAIARKYYDDLDINFPNMDYTEYAANMDLGQVFLEVMTAVNEKGFSFIGPELEKWQELGQVILASTLPASKEKSGDLPNSVSDTELENGACEDDTDDHSVGTSTSSVCASEVVSKSDSRQKKQRYQNSESEGLRKGQSKPAHSKAKREIEDDDVYLDEEDDIEKGGDYSDSSDAVEEYTDRGDSEESAGRFGSIRYSESGDIELDLDGSYFNSFSLSDRNRLLVLSAFDIASNTESFETFDLRLGLALGIVDNDKSRSTGSSSQKMHIMSLPAQFQSSQPYSSKSKVRKSSKPVKVDGDGESGDSFHPTRDEVESMPRQPRRRKNYKIPSSADTSDASDERHENESEDVLDDEDTKSFKEQTSSLEKRGRKRVKRRAEKNNEAAEMDEMNEKVNIIPEVDPSDLLQHSYEEDMGESIGIPPLLRSAIPTLKSESVLASCFIFFTVLLIIAVTILSQQDAQRRKGRIRSVRAPRQKQGLLEAVIGLFSTNAPDSNVDVSVLQNVCNFCIVGIQNLSEYTSEWFGSMLPRAEGASPGSRGDRERQLRASNREEDRPPIRADYLQRISIFFRGAFPLSLFSSANEQNDGEQSEDTESSQDSSESSLCDYADGDKDQLHADRIGDNPVHNLPDTTAAPKSKNASRKNKLKGANSSRHAETPTPSSTDKFSSSLSTERKDGTVPTNSTSTQAMTALSSALTKKKVPPTVAAKPVSKLLVKEPSPSPAPLPLKPNPVPPKKVTKASPPQTEFHVSNGTQPGTEKARSPPILVKSGEVNKKSERFDNVKSTASSDFFIEPRAMRRENSWIEVTREKKPADGLDGSQKASKREESGHQKLAHHDPPVRTTNYGISKVGLTEQQKPADHQRTPTRGSLPGNQSSKLISGTPVLPSLRSGRIDLSSTFPSIGNNRSAASSQETKRPDTSTYTSLPDEPSTLPPLIHQTSALQSYGPKYDKELGSVDYASLDSILTTFGDSGDLFLGVLKSVDRPDIPPPPGLATDSASSLGRESANVLQSPFRVSDPNRNSNSSNSSSAFSNFPMDYTFPPTSKHIAWHMESSQMQSRFQDPKLTSHLQLNSHRSILDDDLVSNEEDREYWSVSGMRSHNNQRSLLVNRPSLPYLPGPIEDDFTPSLEFILPAHLAQIFPLEEDGFNRETDIFGTGSSTSYDFLRELVSTPEPPPPSSERQESRLEHKHKPQQQKGGEIDDMENDYNLTSITKQASALTMLSPDAPSFTPSFKLVPMGISPNMNYPIQANTNIASSVDMSDNSESGSDSNVNASTGFKKWDRSYLNPAAALSFDSPPASAPSEDSMPPSTAVSRGSQNKPSGNRTQSRGDSS